MSDKKRDILDNIWTDVTLVLIYVNKGWVSLSAGRLRRALDAIERNPG